LQDLKRFLSSNKKWPRTYWPPKSQSRGPNQETEHRLAQWVSLQRARKKNPNKSKRPLSQELITKLNLIGIQWEVRSKKRPRKGKSTLIGGSKETTTSTASVAAIVTNSSSFDDDSSLVNRIRSDMPSTSNEESFLFPIEKSLPGVAGYNSLTLSTTKV
jgi:hypothetical protein